MEFEIPLNLPNDVWNFIWKPGEHHRNMFHFI